MFVQPRAAKKGSKQGVSRSHGISGRTGIDKSQCRYIKELADRINSIESKLQSEDGLGHEDLEKFFAQERQRSSTGPVEEATRKRPYSSISGNEFSTPTTNNRQAPWPSESRGAQSESFANYTNASLAPEASPIKPDATPSKQTVASMDIPMPDDDDVPEVGDNILHEYVPLFMSNCCVTH
jgi:hypothetical protein